MASILGIVSIGPVLSFALVCAPSAQAQDNEQDERVLDDNANGILDWEEVEKYWSHPPLEHDDGTLRLLGFIQQVHDDGRVLFDSAVGLVDVVTRKPLWISALEGIRDLDAFCRDGRVRGEGGGPQGKQWNVLDPSTGELRWSTLYRIEEYHYVPRLDIGRDGLPFLTENGLCAGELGVAKLDPETGEVQWTRPSVGKRIGAIAGVADNGMVWGEDEICRLDVETGEELWSTKGLGATIGDIRYADEAGRAWGRSGSAQTWLRNYASGKLANGIALISLRTGKTLYTDADLDEERIGILERLGISDPSRFFGTDFVDHVISVRLRGPGKDRPVAVVFYPEVDINRVYQMNHLDVLSAAYDVLYFEVGDEREFYASLKQVRELEVRVAVAIIAGHGMPGQISFGGVDFRRDDESLFLDLTDREELDRYRGLFQDASVIVDSCHAGTRDGARMADLVAETVGRGAAWLYAPVGVNLVTLLELDSKGFLLRPRFMHGPREIAPYIITGK